VLLDALIASNSRAARRKLLDRLTRTTLDVTPLLVARLPDERWYVQRNLLLLLERLRRVPADFPLTRWVQHADARVRYQALSLQLKLPRSREAAVRAALEDAEPSVIRLGLVAALAQCPPSLVPQLGRLAGNPNLTGELRVHAVRVLGASRDEQALPALLRLVDGGKSFFGGAKLAAPSPVVIAALRALADGWSTHRDAHRFLALARRSFVKELRNAAIRA
jgi:HEAT repeat protein